MEPELLDKALTAWEADDGAFTDDELNAAATALGIARTSRSDAA